LAVVNQSYNVSILLGTGSGSFGTAINFSSGYGPQAIISADFNGDGKADLATGGSSTYDNGVDVLLNCSMTNGITGFTIEQGITIYPNPTSGQFTFVTNFNDKQTIDLYDVNGRRVFSKSIIGTAEIDTNSLDNGIYTLTIKNNADITFKKLVITH
jgi:hypothetical protein